MRELYQQILQGDQDAVNGIVDGWLMRIIHMAGMYDDVPVNMEDLIQEGNMALWMALSALPEVEGAAELDSYLEKQVVAAFENHIREVTGDTDQVQAVLGKAALLHEARKYLAKENSQDPSIRQLSEYTHIRRKKYRIYWRSRRKKRSKSSEEKRLNIESRGLRRPLRFNIESFFIQITERFVFSFFRALL